MHAPAHQLPPDQRLFSPSFPGHWSEVNPEEWQDWRWQMRNRITKIEQLEARITLTQNERAGITLTGNKLAFAVTPHFFNLIDPEDPECPIRRQVIPRLEETLHTTGEMADPCGEDSHMPVPGLVHRYPDRVLLLVTDRCASYCRYCTRSRIVSGAGEQELHTDLGAALQYLREHSEVRDVLLSGGDALLLSDDKLDKLLGDLRAIPHIEFLRIGSRVPIFLPQRITPALVAILRKHHPLWMSVHVNHPKELTTEVKAALERLVDAGIPLGNQSVLLAGVNDDPDTMKELVHRLLMCRVRPYYLYACDLISGSAHLRASIRKGIEIIQSLRGHTTGYAIPQLVIDAPGGGGKVPVNPEYVVDTNDAGITIRNYEGNTYFYPEPTIGTAKETSNVVSSHLA